jgi:dTDP-4-dehydrorhamnose reductase
MQTVLITGASGLVGSHILNLLKTKFLWLAPSSAELNITNKSQTKDYIKNHKFDSCLHLAAYTNVDKAEIEKDKCFTINVTGTKNLFAAVSAKKKPFIFISTEFVFDGNSDQYFEDSLPKPLSYYGKTKYEAEQIVKKNAMIVRISSPYGSLKGPKPDFVNAIYSRLKNNQTVQSITDSTFTPTFLDDLATGFAYLLNHFEKRIFHLTGPESFTPFWASLEIARVFNLNQKLVIPITFEEYFKNRAPRPKKATIKSRHRRWPTHTFTSALKLVKARLS